ncbi:MAG: hypothetical protein IT364_24580 [Candidatus Hydrogenedentes bacterium]|nr:hypothetical protein [Candidatus Hydrogenedentota bacterium]
MSDPALTKDEAESILKESVAAAGAKGAAIPPEMLDWVGYMVNQVDLTAKMIEQDLYEQIRASITAPIDPKALKAAEEMWRDQARRQAQTLAVDMTKQQLRTIGETIGKGLIDGVGPKDIARRLDVVKDLDPQRAKSLLDYEQKLRASGLSDDEIAKQVARKHDQLLRDRRETIARTEARQATAEAGLENAKTRGARFKVWVTTQDARVSDECQGNEAEGPIPIDQTFSGGVDRPPQHPNCRCSLAYITSDEQLERAQERAERRADKTEAAKSGESA